MLDTVVIGIAYTLGILWGLHLDCYLGVVFFFFSVCAYEQIRLSRLKRGLSNKKLRGFEVMIAISFLFGLFYSHYRLEDFQKRYAEGVYYGKGEVISLVEEGSYQKKYRFRNEEGDLFLLYIPKDFSLQENSVIFLTGELKHPAQERNRGGFDYARYLYSQNIYGSLFVSNTENIDILEENKFHLISWIQNHIFEALGSLLPQEQLGILLGMLIGDTSWIREEIKEAFQTSGITHLLAVSGSNVAYVVLLTKTVFQKIVGKSASNILTIFMIILFVLISGASPSVVRAGIMAILLILSEILSRAPNTYSTVATTAIFILCYNPLILCDIGFLLSFGGTLGILFFQSKIKEKMNQKFSRLLFQPATQSASLKQQTNKMSLKFQFCQFIIESLSVTLAAQIFLLPIMWYFFNQISLVSILTNLLVGSMAGVITILGFVTYFLRIFSFSLAQMASYSVYLLISWVIFVSKLCSQIPFGTIQLPTPSFLWIFTYYLVLYRFFSSSKKKQFLSWLLLAFILLQFFLAIIPQNAIEIHIIDVGQGDSMLIQTRHGKNILIDGGGSENSNYDVGEKIVVPYLLDNTNGVIDCMIISHFHEDHAEGCVTVLEKLKVKQIIIGTQPKMSNLYGEVLKIAKEKKIPLYVLVAGDSFTIDEVRVEVVFPKKKIEIPEDFNNNSMVIKIQYEEHSMLLTGDIEAITEERLLEEAIDVDILKVAHHGSKTSSMEEFLKKVSPQIALISVGEENKFGHPHAVTIEKLEALGCQIFRTDESGEITLKLERGGKIKVSQKINV